MRLFGSLREVYIDPVATNLDPKGGRFLGEAVAIGGGGVIGPTVSGTHQAGAMRSCPGTMSSLSAILTQLASLIGVGLRAY